MATNALPITPQASLATEPFSFNREKKPGLPKNKKSESKGQCTYIPKNFRDFINDVALTK